jgi:hypothetical protein
MKIVGAGFRFGLFTLMALGMVVFAAPGAAPPLADWGKLFGDPAILGGILAPAISSLLTIPLTQVIKDWRGWDGKKAELLNGGLNTLVLAVLPFFVGVYPFSLEGLAYAALVSVFGFMVDKGIWKTGKSLSGADTNPLEGQ